MCSSYLLLTSTLERGERSAPCPGHALPLGTGPPEPIGQMAGWAQGLVWMQRLELKSSVHVGDQTLVVQAVVRHCIN
jgi:hypothetical protein